MNQCGIIILNIERVLRRSQSGGDNTFEEMVEIMECKQHIDEDVVCTLSMSKMLFVSMCRNNIYPKRWIKQQFWQNVV